jgi:predicted DNA-binding transcriptional regulator AlpA
MAKRKTDVSLSGQLDLFGALPIPVELQTKQAERHLSPTPANDAVSVRHVQSMEIPQNGEEKLSLASLVPSIYKPSSKAKILSTRAWLSDEWWTLSMICVYLQVSRKTIWNRQQDSKVHFPQPVCMGSSRPRWRSAEIRAWSGMCHYVVRE